MKLLDFSALILAIVSETTEQVWSPADYYSPVHMTPTANRNVKAFCYYIQRDGWLLRRRNYRDGTPCWYSYWWSQRVGYCLRGKCTIMAAPVEIPCDGVHRSPIGGNGRRAGPAGLCMNGVCSPIYEPTLEEDQQTHPSQLLQCPDRKHTGRNILMSCYYYCNENGTWYAGYYDSQPSSGCNLRNPTPEQPLGWCCRGDCIKKYNCEQ
ncbi:uncharacterized protein LOC142768494 isoform X2 [Rhipicephalus microplus]|uniref:uncharacterized protein LOC142768494 isoform X2 n=1 Tax=Rhipicephalus microplus TaxID=6941 RepID=UPI003F6C74E8